MAAIGAVEELKPVVARSKLDVIAFEDRRVTRAIAPADRARDRCELELDAATDVHDRFGTIT